MKQSHDSDLADGSAPFWTVFCWNFDHTKRKIFRSYANETEAKEMIVALASYGIEAEIVEVGNRAYLPAAAT